MHLEVVPATAERWALVAALLSTGRSAGACWCQWFRQLPAEHDAASVDERRVTLRRRIDAGPPPALLALEGDEPVGWLSLGPAEEFRPRLSRWSVAKGVLDDATVEGVWVINCLYVPSERRRTGISGRLIEAAVVHAHRAGARAVIAFPLLAEARSLPEGATGVGYAEPFLAAGFELVPGALDSRAWAVRRLRPEPPPG